jgi:hypothetical protein
MKKLVIVDLNKDNFNLLEEDCYYLNINTGKIKINKSKKILLQSLTKYDVRCRESLQKALKKKLISISDSFNQQLEIFNLRNDKIFSISRLINLLKLNYLIQDEKFTNIKIITDSTSSINVIKSFNNDIQIESYVKEKLKKNFVFIKICKFYIKAFFVITFIKIFPVLKFKVGKELGMTIYPNFFLKEKEILYNDKKITNLNFLLTDETHMGYSFFKIIKIYRKIRHNNFIIVENYINYYDILKGFIKSSLKLIYLNKNNNHFFINKLNFSDFYLSYFNSSFINRSKLEIYDVAIPKIFRIYDIRVFNLYLFEYNFGFFLINLLKKLNIHIKGYQHGIFSTKLFWYDVILKLKHNNFFPNEIIANNSYSFKEYKNLLNKKAKIRLVAKKTSSLLTNLRFTKKNGPKNILILPGTHDVKDLYNYIKEDIAMDDKNKYFFKLHPKNKFIFKSIKNLKIINDLRKLTFNKIIVSSTSTLVYDLNKINIPIEIFSADYKLKCY